MKEANKIHDSARLQEAMDGLKFPTSILDPPARITAYCANLFETLDFIGYANFKNENLKYTIKSMIECINHLVLKISIEDRVKTEPGLEEDVWKFIQSFKKDAWVCQPFRQQVGHNDRIHGNVLVCSNNTSHKQKASAFKEGFGGKNRKITEETSKRALFCVYPPHREKEIRYYIKDCKAWPGHQKVRYLANYRKEWKKNIKNQQKTQRLRASPVQQDRNNHVEESLVLFSAMFADRYRKHVCVNIGADGIIIKAVILSWITAVEADHGIQKLNVPRVFDMIAAGSDGKALELVCLNEVLIDIELQIPHRIALKFCYVRLLVVEQLLSEPLLGRPILKSSGLSTREMLATVAYRLDETFDAERLVESVVQYRGERLTHAI